MKMKPLPFAGKKLIFELLNWDWPKEEILFQRFPIKKLLRTEPKLYSNQVAYYKSVTPYHKPVRIVLYKGKQFIWDGNHRVQARREKGLKTIRALVVEFGV